MTAYHEIRPEDFDRSPFRMIGKEWMLVTAEREGRANTMTASWGGMGVMWGKNVAFVVIRPQRYTKEFVDFADRLSLSFLPATYHKQLGYLGSVSGRDEDKIKQAGLTLSHADGAPYFEEADTVMILRKLYAQPYDPTCFIDPQPDREWYPEKDYHTLYIAEIESILTRK